ncbi:alpha/beta hydrolase [Bacillus sp. FJAT-42376]|uniref:alpha/beta fold hydrolase n=1 Tax=Bacillus sp. FJAT-42376 TaxID=2014076 RepID=UPI000F4E80BE|nr:alpha/beta hydrolase [Bacillus sp. FJAT-42376]AZB42209.1 alpha/beta hydrolase [Bacillus sp. FJAT-42376]
MDLHAEVQGSGRPVVLIHGPGTDLREWVFIVPYLLKTCQVISYDGRGSGKSPSPLGPMNPVDDLRMLMDDLHIEKATIVGHSRGGQVAADFALTDPSRIEKLILISPSLTGYEYSAEYNSWLDRVNSAPREIDRVVELVIGGPHHTIVKASEHHEFFKEMMTNYVRKALTEWKSYEVNWPEPPAIQRLKEMKASTLFIQGTKEFEDIYQIREYYGQVPLFDFVLLPRADHMSTLTHPAEIAGNILEFIKEEAKH